MRVSVRSNIPRFSITASSNSNCKIEVRNTIPCSVSAYVNLIPHNITIIQNSDPLLEERVRCLEENDGVFNGATYLDYFNLALS